jgi:hypothetical protein
MQGTSSRWAEIHKAKDAQDLQQRLNIIIKEHLDKYPVKRLGYVCRQTVFPDLYTKYRVFDIGKFDINAAYDFLAQKPLQRKVANNGTISLYGKAFYVDLNTKRQFVTVKFNPQNVAWHVLNQKKEIIKQIPELRMSKENIFLLTACQKT